MSIQKKIFIIVPIDLVEECLDLSYHDEGTSSLENDVKSFKAVPTKSTCSPTWPRTTLGACLRSDEVLSWNRITTHGRCGKVGKPELTLCHMIQSSGLIWSYLVRSERSLGFGQVCPADEPWLASTSSCPWGQRRAFSDTLSTSHVANMFFALTTSANVESTFCMQKPAHPHGSSWIEATGSLCRPLLL